MKVNDNIDYTEIITGKDDIYNLSVRKKAAFLCNKIIDAVKLLNSSYIMLDSDEIASFIEDNNQITVVCNNILKTVNVKSEQEKYEFAPRREDIRLYICYLLTETAESIISLSNIISIRHIERELIYASEIILKQLLYILPYKTEQ